MSRFVRVIGESAKQSQMQVNHEAPKNTKRRLAPKRGLGVSPDRIQSEMGKLRMQTRIDQEPPRALRGFVSGSVRSTFALFEVAGRADSLPTDGC
jgi:hypothetical protein